MTVSVIIPAYNACEYVGQAIDSVLAQGHRDLEIIVVDDGSVDDTPSALACFGHRITTLRQDNCGVSRALNAGIAVARGDLLAFVDADDLWLSGKLDAQIAILASEPDIDAVFGMMRAFRDLGQDPGERRYIGDESEGLVKGTMLVRRSAFDRVGPFDPARSNADFVDWFSRAQACGLRWKILDRLVYLRRVHSDNLGRRLKAAQNDAYLDIMKSLLDRRRRQGD